MCGLALAAVVVYALPGLLPGGPTAREGEQRVSARDGVACKPLSRAQEALAGGDTRALVASIREANKVALRSLRSGAYLFGKPEELALRLASERLVPPIPSHIQRRIEMRLTKASEACSRRQNVATASRAVPGANS